MPRRPGGEGGARSPEEVRTTVEIDPAWLETDFYEVLGVGSDADGVEITRAYRRLARDLHPDANPDPAAEDRFKALTAAYHVLRDPPTRAAYDRARGRRLRRRAGGGYSIPVDHVDARRGPGAGSAGRREPSDDLGRSGSRSRAARQQPDVRAPFGRRDDDLTLTVPVTFAEAARGADIEVPTLEGEPVTVRLPPGTPSGRVLRVRGRGRQAARGGRGDLLITVVIHVPADLTERQRALLDQLAETEDPRALRAHLAVGRHRG